MPVITEKCEALKVMEKFSRDRLSMAVFCTASHWNTEAILLAASRYARKKGIDQMPITVAITYNYKYMAQARRVTRSGNPRTGFISLMKHLDTLCGHSYSDYHNIIVLPHLDHANPFRDQWPLSKGLGYLASVMFDAQELPYEENMELTRNYVRFCGQDTLVEGIIEQLGVEGIHGKKQADGYVEKAVSYIDRTRVDFLVADLGTEQQSTSAGNCSYLAQRAVSLTERLGKPMLVLHGTSCLSKEQIYTLGNDGVIRVNMWTRIAREAGQHAARNIASKINDIQKGSFEAAESRQYIHDSIEKAAEIMEDVLDVLSYL